MNNKERNAKVTRELELRKNLVELGFVPMDRHNPNFLINENGVIYNAKFKKPKLVKSSVTKDGKDEQVSICLDGHHVRKKSVCNLVYQYFIYMKDFRHSVRKIDASLPISPSNLEVMPKNKDGFNQFVPNYKKHPNKRAEYYQEWNGGDFLFC